MIHWHRLFGLILSDFFSDTPYSVELERDLSLRQQFLDVIIVKKHAGSIQRDLPDGLDNLTTHNLLSYKSLHEPLDQWALEELIDHFVNYRKQVRTESGQRLSRHQIQLYAVSTRWSEKLIRQGVGLQAVQTKPKCATGPSIISSRTVR